MICFFFFSDLRCELAFPDSDKSSSELISFLFAESRSPLSVNSFSDY